MITVVHGVFRCHIPFDGQTVETVRQAAKDHMAIAEDAASFVNGKRARSTHVLKSGDKVEFAIADDEATRLNGHR